MSELLEREFEKLHGIKWADAAFSVRACWTDAWLTATAHEREACAKIADARAMRCEAKVADAEDEGEEINLRSLAWQFSVLADEMRKRSNA